MKENYQKQLDALLASLPPESKPRLLLQSCCGPCSSYVLEYLTRYFRVTVLYYNPNIQPRAEYDRRLYWQQELIRRLPTPEPVQLLDCGYDGQRYIDAVRGLEREPEGGARCTVCFRLRLEETARQAVDHLYDHGHRRIAALICREDDQSISQLRYQGYRKALESHGIPLDEDLVMCTGTFDIRDAYEAVSRRLRQGADFTALFAIADSMAIGAMRALRDAGRRVPEDCSVIAIDGLELSAYIEPPLTTLCQPMEEMGRRSAQILLGMLRGHGSHCCEVLPTQLREGGSVRSV